MYQIGYLIPNELTHMSTDLAVYKPDEGRSLDLLEPIDTYSKQCPAIFSLVFVLFHMSFLWKCTWCCMLDDSVMAKRMQAFQEKPKLAPPPSVRPPSRL